MKTWLITGTSSGFGRIMTQQLLERGDRVAATLRRPEALSDLQQQFGVEQLHVSALDVTDQPAVEAVVDRAFGDLGTIDVIVNNAGYGLYAAIEEPSLQQIRQVIDTNLMGSIHVIRAALPHLRTQGAGRILQISSAGGQLAFPGFGYYHAAKWGIEAICESLAAEVTPLGISVTIVEPGMTPTGFTAGKDLALSIPEYDTGTFGDARERMREGRSAGMNNAEAIVRAIITSTNTEPAPLRLPLGIDTYYGFQAAYTDRLNHLENGRDVALSVAEQPPTAQQH